MRLEKSKTVTIFSKWICLLMAESRERYLPYPKNRNGLVVPSSLVASKELTSTPSLRVSLATPAAPESPFTDVNRCKPHRPRPQPTYN